MAPVFQRTASDERRAVPLADVRVLDRSCHPGRSSEVFGLNPSFSFVQNRDFFTRCVSLERSFLSCLCPPVCVTTQACGGFFHAFIKKTSFSFQDSSASLIFPCSTGHSDDCSGCRDSLFMPLSGIIITSRRNLWTSSTASSCTI